MEHYFLIKEHKSVKTKKPILIQGLPGIGNVGKIAVEFMIQNLKAEKIYDIVSSHFPSAVFITEKETIELPKISIFYKKLKNVELLFVNGDFQPLSEGACYALSEKIIEVSAKHKVQEIISLGGMGLEQVPEHPKVYFAGTNPAILKKYKPLDAKSIFGSVGPIVGMAGVLLGVAKEKNLPGVILLAETLAHPTYIGMKGARELINTLNTKLALGINISELDTEINVLERTIQEKITKAAKLAPKEEKGKGDQASYIG